MACLTWSIPRGEFYASSSDAIEARARRRCLKALQVPDLGVWWPILPDEIRHPGYAHVRPLHA